MNYPTYKEVKASSDLSLYAFNSIGPKGEVFKVIQYAPLTVEGRYNLAFGDWNGERIVDDARTNNGDRNKVLATVAATVYEYTSTYPERVIHFKGFSHSRTRLYRQAITLNLEELETDFTIQGIIGDVAESFIKDKDYDAFLFTRK